MAKAVNIVIDKDGKIQLDAEGYQGKGCQQAVDAIAEHLKLGTAESAEHKAEYYATEKLKETA
jgi:hypothetical protein